MAYTRTTWVNDSAPAINASNLNKIEDGIEDAHTLMSAPAVNNQTGTSYTVVASDAGKIVTCTNAAAITLTVPPNSSVDYPVGTRIVVVQRGAGQVTFVEGSGVTVDPQNGGTLVTLGENAAVELIQLATDEWLLVGQLEPA